MDSRRPSPRRTPGAMGSSAFGMLCIGLATAWAIEILDTVVTDGRLQRGGIHPRRLDGLDGIAWMPFLHSTFGHLISNSVPLLVLGGLVAARGRRYWARVTLAGIVIGGLGVWAIGGAGNHIGASGVVFTYFGALLGAAWFERRPAALGGALIALFFYSGTLTGLVPQDAVSWEGHLSGFVVGLVTSRVLAAPRRRVGSGSSEPRYAWEVDEPWNR